MTQGWIGATDGDVLRDPAGVITRARTSLRGIPGWALDAPWAVAFDRASTVPLVLARSLSLGEDAGVNWSREATLVVSRAECGGVWVGNAFASLDLPFTTPASVVIPDDGARVSGCELVNLRALLPAIPWREGTLTVTALVGARRSDPVTVSLRRAVARDPQVQDPGLNGGDLNVSGASSEMQCARWRLDRTKLPEGTEARRLGHGGWDHLAVGVKTGPVPSWSEGRVALSDTSNVIQWPFAACDGNPHAKAKSPASDALNVKDSPLVPVVPRTALGVVAPANAGSPIWSRLT